VTGSLRSRPVLIFLQLIYLHRLSLVRFLSSLARRREGLSGCWEGTIE